MGNPKARELLRQKELTEAWERAQWVSRGLSQDVDVPGLGGRRVRVMYVPSFTKGYSWDIRILGAEMRLFYSEVVSCYNGSSVLRGYHEIQSNPEILARLFQRLLKVSLPIGPDLSGQGGLDGTLFRLSLFGDLSSKVSFEWWCEPPAQWGELGALVSEMIEIFSSWMPVRKEEPHKPDAITLEGALEIRGRLIELPHGDIYDLGDGWWIGHKGNVIGSGEVIVDKADGHVHRLGSSMGQKTWMHAHRCGFRHKKYLLTISAIRMEDAARRLLSALGYDTSSLSLTDLPWHFDFGWNGYDRLDEISRAHYLDYHFTVTECDHPACAHIGSQLPDLRQFKLGAGYEADFAPECMETWRS